jgi:hypothetical protein
MLRSMRTLLFLFLFLVPIPSLLVAARSKHVQVAITPASVTVVSAGTQQFSATLSGTPDKRVTWSTSAGTITSSGSFTAPAPSQLTTVYVKATSTAEPTKSATATVTITPATQHIVDLNWNGSTSTNISGYNVYRGMTSAGPYAKINAGLVASTLYTDSSVVSGQTYYYTVTAVDSSGAESGYSSQTQAVVPIP